MLVEGGSISFHVGTLIWVETSSGLSFFQIGRLDNLALEEQDEEVLAAELALCSAITADASVGSCASSFSLAQSGSHESADVSGMSSSEELE